MNSNLKELREHKVVDICDLCEVDSGIVLRTEVLFPDARGSTHPMGYYCDIQNYVHFCGLLPSSEGGFQKSKPSTSKECISGVPPVWTAGTAILLSSIGNFVDHNYPP